MLTDFIQQKFTTLLHIHTYVLAFSGGLDSQVLLQLCASALKNTTKKLRAIHVNHGLSANALQWQSQCQAVCDQLAIPLQCVQVNAAPQPGKSPEAVARELRYQAFKELLVEDECLLTAHHQNDQAETVLLQLLRGAGPAGLAAMPELTSFAKGYLLRPLLNFTRAELLQYATQQQLDWIEDESNLNTAYDRNFIRHQILPLLEQRWPAATTTLARAAANCAEAAELLQVLGEQDGELFFSRLSLSLANLRQLDITDPTYSRSRNVIRTWLKQQNFAIPSRSRLQQLHHDFMTAKIDANPHMTWNGVEIRRYKDAIYAMSPLLPLEMNAQYHWNLNTTLDLPHNLGKLCGNKQRDQGFVLPDADSLVTVRFRRGGERCQPSGHKGTHTLKKLLQEWDVAPWQRDRIPLLYWRDQLVAVVGFCICEPFKVEMGKEGWMVDLYQPSI
ncbi:tRNA lysidine(34) synthetase TilS [soil metagenome]